MYKLLKRKTIETTVLLILLPIIPALMLKAFGKSVHISTIIFLIVVTLLQILMAIAILKSYKKIAYYHDEVIKYEAKKELLQELSNAKKDGNI